MIEILNVSTSNVSKELLRIAAQNGTSASHLYIKLNSTQTFVTNPDSDADSDLLEIFGKDFDTYKSETTLRDNTILFKQEYNIDVHSVYKEYPFKEMKCEIEFEKNDTLAYLVIKEGSQLSYYDGLYNDFLKYITEQLLRAHVMLYLFNVEYEQGIEEFVKVIEKIKKITFKEDKRILLSQGLDEEESISSEICMHIEEGSDVGTEDEQGKMDYSDRGFLLSCDEGDQLFEFIKPQQGQHGRNCLGEIIEVEIVNLEAKPTFTVEDGIEVQDSFENIKYLSKRSGYIVKKGNQYDVSNNIDVHEISFKTTGTIDSDLDSEISINVIKDNPLEDAVEEGMNVKVQKLSVKGNIGPFTNIEARDIFIDGQTHNDSTIQCVNAKIGQHRGKIKGRTVEVETLEGGEITADKVIVKNAIRGKIRARVIEIELLGSHVVMEASEYIEVEKIKGEENKFIIDTSIKSIFGSSKKGNEKDYLKKLEGELKILLKKVKDITAKVKDNKEPCEKIKAAIIECKNKGIKISATLIKNFKICKVTRVHYKTLREDAVYKKNQVEKLKKKIFGDASDVEDSKIVIKQPIDGFNKIMYKLYNPDREISIKTSGRMKGTTFKLAEDDEGIYKIVKE